MSRWDALKPGNTSRRKQTETRQRNYRKERARHHGDLNDRHDDDVVASVDACFALREQYLRLESTEETAMALVKSSKAVLDQIPVSQVAELLVRDVFLRELAKPAVTRPCQQSLLKTIQKLLQSPSHASTIMAPLVEDVSVEGKEQLIVNPIRMKLFQVLQQRLLGSADDNNESSATACCTCETLTIALQVAYKIEQTRRHANTSDVDVAPYFIQSMMIKWLPKQDLMLMALDLLHAFLTRHPYAAPSLAMTLLESACHSFLRTCPSCGYSGSSILLDCSHGHFMAGYKVTLCANECTSLILRNIPLELWLSTSNSSNSSRFRSTLDFHDRISRVLEDVLCATKCQMEFGSRMGSCVDKLVINLFKIVPFQHAKKVLQAGIRLVDVTVWLMDGAEAHQSISLECLTEAAGGSVTPEGELVPMCLPLRIWLDADEGRNFFQHLLSRLPYNSDARAFQLIGALLRSHPALILKDTVTAQVFSTCLDDIFIAREVNIVFQGHCLEMVQGLLKGRRDYPTETALANNFDIVDIERHLFALIQSSEETTRRAACTAYGFLLPSDWHALLQRGQNIDCKVRFSSMLSVCQSDSIAKGRAEAWKSFGDMCTHFLAGQLHPSYSNILVDVLGALAPIICRTACLDSTEPAVKAMVLFALGNVAQALNDSALPLLLVKQFLHDFVNAAWRGLSNPDDRVVSNAVRAVAQIYCLLQRYEIADFRFKEILAFLDETVATAVISSRPSKQFLTWKQRSGIKKLACGACNGLKLMLGAGIASDSDVKESFKSCVCTLVSCVEISFKMHEKVVCCAASALRAIDLTAPALYCEQSQIASRCLTACITAVFDHNRERLNEKLCLELELLLEYVVTHCSISDLSSALACPALNESHLQAMSDWMLVKDLPSTCFEKVSLAVQQSSVLYDVAIEQKFINRARFLFLNESDDEL